MIQKMLAIYLWVLCLRACHSAGGCGRCAIARPRGATPRPRSGAAAESTRLWRRSNGREEHPAFEVGGAAERRYPASEVRGGDQEELPHAPKHKARGNGQEELPHTPTPEARGSGRKEQPMPEARGGNERSYPTSEVRGGGREELPHDPMPKARGGSREEQPMPEARGSDEKSYPEPWRCGRQRA